MYLVYLVRAVALCKLQNWPQTILCAKGLWTVQSPGSAYRFVDKLWTILKLNHTHLLFDFLLKRNSQGDQRAPGFAILVELGTGLFVRLFFLLLLGPFAFSLFLGPWRNFQKLFSLWSLALNGSGYALEFGRNKLFACCHLVISGSVIKRKACGHHHTQAVGDYFWRNRRFSCFSYSNC